eukprot:SAG31_NODE_22259_length_530_cov_0.837587_1_plen_55_part_01
MACKQKYRKLLVDLDTEATRNGNKGLLMRTPDRTEFLQQLAGTRAIDANAGVDMR